MHYAQQVVTLAFIITSLLLSGCQLTPNQVTNNTHYGEYYLALQQLKTQQLSDEVTQLQSHIKNANSDDITKVYDLKIKLLLLYSLPKSPIYNSYTAKALLNELHSENDNAAFLHLVPSEQAFFSLLHDQLNQRLLTINRLQTQHSAQLQQQEQKNQQLTEQVALLELTIKQLKSIEQAIDKREQ